MNRIILTTGGTGGHVFPALAVAEELKRLKDMQILFVGSKYGPEQKMATQAELAFEGLPVRGVLGRGIHAIGASVSMLRAIVMAIAIMRKFKPQAVMGFGGYAAFAPMIAAQLLGIKTIVHEQNAIAGLSNKIQGFFAKKIFLALPNTQGFNSKKTIVTGNPVRSSISNLGKIEHDFSGRRLLVVGGSQGAKALNDLIINNFELFNAAGISILHQSGKSDFERVRDAYVEGNQSTKNLCAFIDDMTKAYDFADLVLCRSGASTIAELASVGRGAILVPFPFATHDHQSHNAELLVKQGAAQMFAEKDMLSQGIVKKIIELLENPLQLQKMANEAKELSMGQAARNIVQNIMAII